MNDSNGPDSVRTGGERGQPTRNVASGTQPIARLQVSERFERSSGALNAAGHPRAQRDVSPRQTSRDTIRKLTQALDLTEDGIFITDRSGSIEYVNPAFERMMRCSRADVLGRQPRLFKSGEHRVDVYRRLWGTLLAGEVFRGVFVDRRLDGETVHLDETITPLRDAEGRISHFVAAVRDVTDRARTEQLLRHLNDSLEQQARRIAEILHGEAGSFLTAAHIALSEAARDLPQPACDRLADVRANLDRIEERLRSLAHEFRPRILDDLGLAPAIEFLANGFERRWGVPVTVEATALTGLPAIVETTVYRLVQEALTNISRHANASRVVITLDQSGPSLRCSILDDGVGFDVTTALDRPGAPGLGLKCIRSRVEALGGSVRIHSAVGGGTELSATIPAGAPECRHA